ncbi:LysR family transcriptional regulator [Pseudoduganella umbonata]|uniref:DNA-binding transcriptional LysR family regulator n=1 Tax=Pseudoduganella umbonata TaxID=864828 RepID=A0A4P8HZT4_9BURK|nr:LysR family transcriptional regulator [Pseudoduganella umbonata]MBB3221967.1 DNA-binding transcriptional LysR family regulator [Pseudoduganella umbonata]QCP14240.1 LysR family transcriptional regulator [Pseudoduganella umbonata]
MGFDADNIRLLLAAVDRGSFSAAARALNRVPSAVSMAIANLEAELGVQLFDRSGREPKPTAAALALLPQARLLVEQMHRLDMHARALTQGLETALALAIVPELGAAAPWSDALRQLAAEFPLLQVEVLTAPQQDALAMVQSGRVHLALVFERYGMTAEESFQEIGEETLVAVVAPHHPMLAGARAGGIRDEDLQSQRQVVVAGRDSQQVDKRFAISAIQWRTDSPSAALSLVAAGLGWAWLPSGFVRDAVAGGSLVQLPLQNLTNVLRLYVDVVWASQRPLGVAARRFVELLNAHRAGQA